MTLAGILDTHGAQLWSKLNRPLWGSKQEIRWSQRTCLTYFENVRQWAVVKINQISSKGLKMSCKAQKVSVQSAMLIFVPSLRLMFYKRDFLWSCTIYHWHRAQKNRIDHCVTLTANDQEYWQTHRELEQKWTDEHFTTNPHERSLSSGRASLPSAQLSDKEHKAYIKRFTEMLV